MKIIYVLIFIFAPVINSMHYEENSLFPTLDNAEEDYKYQPALRQVFKGHSRDVRSVLFTPEGLIVSGSDDKTVRVFNPKINVEPIILEGHHCLVKSVAYISKNRIVSCDYSRRAVKVWDLEEKKCIKTVEHPRHNFGTAVASDGETIYSASGTVCSWKTDEIKPKVIFDPNCMIWSIACCAHGKIIAGLADNTARLLDPSLNEKDNRNLNVFKGHTDWVNTVTPSACSDSIVTGSSDTTVRLWDIQTGSSVRVFNGHTSCVNSVASDKKGLIISGSSDKTIRAWDERTGSDVALLKEKANIYSIACSDDSMISGSQDGSVRLWDLRKIRS